MDFSPYFGFAAISLALVMTPGADWAYSIAAGLRPRSAAPSIAGLCTGYVLHTALAAAGLGLVLAARPGVVAWLSLAGAFYLAWLGLGTIRSWREARIQTLPEAGSAGPAPVPSGSGRGRDFWQGLGTSGINPKGVLLFAAIMPQFITQTSPLPVAAQTALMGLSHIILCVLVYGLVAFAARRLLRSRPRLAQRVTLASGLLMLAIAVVLVTEQAGHLLV